MGDLAKKLNIITRTIRYYDQKGLVKPSRVSESGYRLYSAKQVKQLKLIIFLKELGFSLKDIQKILEDKNGDKLIDLLLKDQLKRNKEETRKLEEQNKKIIQLQQVLSKPNNIAEVTDITKIMNNETRYKKVIRSMWKLSAVEIAVELL
ncbi:transcriptional regulator, partial [Lactobacillus sp. UMNPBX8]